MVVSSAVANGSDGLADDVHDDLWGGDEWCVIDWMGAHAGLHAFRHEALVLMNDHPILLGHEVPGRTVLPQGPLHRDCDAGGGDRALNGRQHSAATSSPNEVSGSGAARVLMPSVASAPITLAQLEPSAQAPWARITLTSLGDISCSLAALSNRQNSI